MPAAVIIGGAAAVFAPQASRENLIVLVLVSALVALVALGRMVYWKTQVHARFLRHEGDQLLLARRRTILRAVDLRAARKMDLIHTERFPEWHRIATFATVVVDDDPENQLADLFAVSRDDRRALEGWLAELAAVHSIDFRVLT